jgi:hypothetical protein
LDYAIGNVMGGGSRWIGFIPNGIRRLTMPPGERFGVDATQAVKDRKEKVGWRIG